MKESDEVMSIISAIRVNVDGIAKVLDNYMAKRRPHGLLLVSDDIENYDALLACCKPGVSAWVYSRKWTLAEFMAKLQVYIEHIPDSSLTLCGWVFHGMDANFSMVSDARINPKDTLDVKQWQHVIDMILKVKTKMKTTRLDLLACCMATNPKFEFARGLLEMVTGLKLASSDDITGNVEGGDWVLESGDVALIGTYFMEDTEERLRNVPIHMNAFSLCK